MSIEIYSYRCPEAIAELTYVVVDKDTNESVVIDPGTINDEMLSVIKATDLKYIVLTHAHPDHIFALPDLQKEYPDVPVIVNENDIDLLESVELNHSDRIYGYPITGKADICPADGESISFGSGEMKFIHTPGHTKGGMCVLIGNDLFSGDTLFRHTVGRTDLYGGDWNTLKKSIKEKLYELPDDITVYPGHGGKTSIGNEKRSNPFV